MLHRSNVFATCPVLIRSVYFNLACKFENDKIQETENNNFGFCGLAVYRIELDAFHLFLRRSEDTLFLPADVYKSNPRQVAENRNREEKKRSSYYKLLVYAI